MSPAALRPRHLPALASAVLLATPVGAMAQSTQPTPRLVITTPASVPARDGHAAIVVVVRNHGDATARRVWVSGRAYTASGSEPSRDMRTIPSIAPGRSTIVSLRLRVPPSRYDHTAQVAAGTGSMSTLTRTVRLRPVLSRSRLALTTPSSAVSRNGTATFIAIVRNSGTRIERNLRVDATVPTPSGTSRDTRTIPAVAPGQRRIVVLRLRVPPIRTGVTARVTASQGATWRRTDYVRIRPSALRPPPAPRIDAYAPSAGRGIGVTAGAWASASRSAAAGRGS